MKKYILQILVISFVFLMPFCGGSVFAGSQGLGGISQNLLAPVGLFSDLIQTACFIIGGAFLLASIIKYFDHKRSPLMIPISTVIFLFIAGLLLLGIPFLSHYLNTGM